MAKKVNVAFVNADRIIKKFKELQDVDKVKVIKKATLHCHGQAKELCPEDTGELKRSIHYSCRDKGSNTVGKVYTNKEYAPYVEFGTGKTGEGTYEYENEVKDRYGLKLEYKQDAWKTGLGYKTNGQVAQPFMYPALKKSEEYMLELMKNDLKDEIDKKMK